MTVENHELRDEPPFVIHKKVPKQFSIESEVVMKRLTLVLIVVMSLAFSISQANARWASVIPTFTQSDFGLPILDIHFANPDTGYAIGWAGGFYRTVDNGRSWLQLSTPPKKGGGLLGIYFLNSQEGWMVGNGSYRVSPGIILHTVNSGANWDEQTNPDPNNTLYGAVKVGDELWVVGVSYTTTPGPHGLLLQGLLLRSADHGLTWSSMVFPNNRGLSRIEVVDIRNIWLIGEDTVLETKDGGSTWIDRSETVKSAIGRGPGTYFRRIVFVSDQVGYLVGNITDGDIQFAGKFYITTNGGQTWTLRKEWGSGAMQPLGMAVSNGTIYVAGGIMPEGKDYDLGVVLASSDSGKTWREDYRSDLKWSTLYGGLVQIGDRIWGGGKDFVYRTNDPPLFEVNLGIKQISIAEQWQYQPRAADPDGDPLTFSFLEAPGFLAIDPDSGNISLRRALTVSDIGDHKVVVQVSDPDGLTDIWTFVLPIVGQSTAVEDELVAGIPAKFALRQNYPNPFNPATTIGYSLAQDGHIRLSVYDLTGQEVAALVNERQAAGAHEVIFNASHLAGGVYLYRLVTDTVAETKKMALIK